MNMYERNQLSQTHTVGRAEECEPVRETTIGEQTVHNLSDAVAWLSSRIQNLESKLQPIMCAPMPEGLCKEPPREEWPEYFSAIRGLTNDLNRLTDIVDSFHARIKL